MCLPKNHRLAKNKSVSFDELKKETFILQQKGTYQQQKVFELCAKSGFNPQVLLFTSQLNVIKQLVMNNAGISFLPHFVVCNDKELCCKKLSPPMNFNVALAWSSSHSNIDTETGVDFINCVKSSFKLR